MKKLNKGFTLIELLVVIAIIGILSSVVLASLNTARTKGTDAAIKGEVSSARGQAEIYFDTNSNYTSVCTAAATAGGLSAIVAGIDTKTTGDCQADANEWAVTGLLRTGTGVYFCADYTGKAATTSFAATGLVDGDIDCD